VGSYPFAASSAGLGLLAATAAAGVALANGTPTFLTWTAPTDGKLHRVIIFAELSVTVIEVGGQVTASVTTPSGTVDAKQMFAAAQAPGVYTPAAVGFPQVRNVQSGGTVSVFQNSALTSGASAFWGELWGS
jgi:hypothetical protein